MKFDPIPDSSKFQISCFSGHAEKTVFGLWETPVGGKEFEVLVKSLHKMEEKDNNSNFLSSDRCFPEVQTMLFRNGPKKHEIWNFELSRIGSNFIVQRS